ncbi:NAD-dependent epimerase/dehydratase family protein [Candidatus Poribacteria bacterium]|nr:NAD-dependent epimerase/dehydratase family protein [Candidatus Poribacteria bacterium]
MSRICVTGASGYLGSRICSQLRELGHELIRVDMTPPQDNSGEFCKADFRDIEATVKALGGVEMIIHCASIHPWKSYTDEEYLDCNIKGTWNVLQAAVKNKIRKVIITSSIAASGYNPPPEIRPADESFQNQALRDIYGLTKFFQEQNARHFCAYKGLNVIALRPPNFTPKTPVQTGAALLSGCLLVEDIASAHVKAVDVWDKLDTSFEPFFITPTYPYSKDEIPKLSTDPKGILDKYYPGAYDWFAERDVKLQLSETLYSSEKAKRLLGWETEHDFGWWWKNQV